MAKPSDGPQQPDDSSSELEYLSIDAFRTPTGEHKLPWKQIEELFRFHIGNKVDEISVVARQDQPLLVEVKIQEPHLNYTGDLVSELVKLSKSYAASDARQLDEVVELYLVRPSGSRLKVDLSSEKKMRETIRQRPRWESPTLPVSAPTSPARPKGLRWGRRI